VVTCGTKPPGVAPTVTFTVTGVYAASNTAKRNWDAGAGPGHARAAARRQQIRRRNAVRSGDPSANTPGIASLSSTAATIAIGSAGSYAATVRNPGAALSSVVLQGWMNQGATRRAAGGTLLVIPGQAVGALPTGMFDVTGTIAVSNATGGTGTLVAGPRRSSCR
jgi:hypothetical protein